MSGPTPMIESRGLCKSFHEKTVLKNLDLKVNRSETMAIIGRSGCGKSVFLKHIIGLVKADGGTLVVDGVDVAALTTKQLNKLCMRFGMLFQSSALFDSMTVAENVGFSLIEHTDLNA